MPKTKGPCGLIALERIPEESTYVTVKAGTTLSELNTVLEEHGLAMINLGSISLQTVGGAVSTGTNAYMCIHVHYTCMLYKVSQELHEDGCAYWHLHEACH